MRIEEGKGKFVARQNNCLQLYYLCNNIDIRKTGDILPRLYTRFERLLWAFFFFVLPMATGIIANKNGETHLSSSTKKVLSSNGHHLPSMLMNWPHGNYVYGCDAIHKTIHKQLG